MRPTSALPLLVLALAISACNGGTIVAGGGIGGTGISFGPIAGFGSIFVNGTEFDTSGATIEVEDEADGHEESLQLGMMVTVNGTISADGTRGTANRIRFSDNVEGVVTAADPVTATLTVLGQSVLVNTTTVFELDHDESAHEAESTQASQRGPLYLQFISVGDIVEVSGPVNAGGEILATRIEAKGTECLDDQTELEIRSTVKSPDLNTKTFVLGGMQVDYSAISGFAPVAGELVEVRSGDCTSAATGTLRVNSISVDDERLDATEGDKIELDGFVVNLSGSAPRLRFEIRDQVVVTNEATVFGVGTARDIANNVHVEVNGLVNSSGALIARSLSLED